MKHYGLAVSEGSTITNITVPAGSSFPGNDTVGELFFRSDLDTLYIRDNTTWKTVLTAGSSDADTLELQNGAYYLDLGNSTGVLDGGTF